jgi:PPOX class probable F420-dependent enzyme
MRVSELSMTKSEREEFLVALHVGMLAVERPDGPPLVSPVWYRCTPGGEVEFVTGSTTEKARWMESSGRASLCAQREELPYAYVTVDGPVAISEADRETRFDIAVRYLGEELGTAYINSTADADHTLVRLTPERWRTTDFAKMELPES